MISHIRDVYPLKAQFMRGEAVETAVELQNPTVENKEFEIDLKVMRLLDEVENIKCKTVLAPGESKSLTILLKPRDSEFEGYGVDVSLNLGGEPVSEHSTSFDVVSDWRKAVRYGFLSDFGPGEKGDGKDVESMCKLHLNLVQFYDWAYRHNDMIPPARVYSDLMGKKSDLGVVEEKISLCHRHGMKALAYGAVYAACTEFCDEHREWALYNSSGEVYDFIGIFKIMNTAPDSPWHEHIIGEYEKAVARVGFDGIHMDTYGYPKAGVSGIGGGGRIERLEEHFPILVNNTRKALEKVKEDVCLIFNNVGNWPVDTVAGADQDAIYIEVWKPYERYHHIQQIIQWARHLGKGKQVILAAYLEPFREAGGEIRLAENAALILTAAISANGGYHLLLGEHNGILTQGYYVDHSFLEDGFVRTIRNYYNFIVRYSKILFNSDMRDVSMTHVHGDNREYVFESATSAEFSTYGEPGKVWVIVRESKVFKSVNFINLAGNSEDYWNRGKNPPVVQRDICVRIQVMSEPKSVFAASPDINMGRPEKLEYRIEDSDRGKVAAARLPELHFWSLLVLEL